MFTRIQARHFRCLKSIDQQLGPFQALVGRNATGKTTFLEVIGFLSDLVQYRGDIGDVIRKRWVSFSDVTWMGRENSFEIAIEAKVPEDIRARHATASEYVRYEIRIGLNEETQEIEIQQEGLWRLAEPSPIQSGQREFFPAEQFGTAGIMLGKGAGRKAVVTKTSGGNDNYYPERDVGHIPTFKLGRTRSALANLPADEENYPVSTWFRGFLESGVQPFMLDSRALRQPSPPHVGRRFRTDGSNLPLVIAGLRKDRTRYEEWLEHVRTALEDIKDIDTVENSADKYRHLVIEYENGARVPSWLVSDGTLRLLALTIPAYLADLRGVFLIEEPENGIHPQAIETVLQSLSSMYNSQVLIATHSTIALGLIKPEDILCFAKDSQGATDIVSGDRHPMLQEWIEGKPDLGTLLAAGILS